MLDRNDVGICDKGEITALNVAAFSAAILPAIDKRLDARPKWQKLDRKNSGHAIMTMTGICQEFGALTIGEIREYLNAIGLIDPRLNNYLYCAQLLGWLRRVRKGNHIYYVAVPGDSALDYKLDAATGFHDKLRWRSDIRTYWQKHDAPRHRAIADVISSLALAL